MTRMILSKSKVTLDKNCPILNFYSNKLSRYKTHDLRKFLIPDALKHLDYKICSTGVKFIKFYL